MAGFTAAIIGAAVSSFGFAAAGIAGSTIFGLSALGSFLVRAAIGVALNALSPKPRSPSSVGSTTSRGYTVNQRGSALDHQIVYGRMRVGGVITFRGVTGINNKFLQEVISYTGHEIESFDEIWINDAKVTSLSTEPVYNYTYTEGDFPQNLVDKFVTSSNLVATGGYTSSTSPTASAVAASLGIASFVEPLSIKNVVTVPVGNVKEVLLPDGTTSGRYDGFVTITQNLGSPDQVADVSLVNAVPEWTSEHRLRGISYLYIKYDFSQDVFPNGVPHVTATIKGKKVYDPRSDTTVWSDNPALCLRDYLTNGYGLDEAAANIDDALVTSAANVCDQTNTDAGTTRYTCNGAFTTNNPPYDILGDMLTSMGGLLWYAQGRWRMKPAYWVAPTVVFTEDDLRSSIAVKTRQSRRDNFNTVRGTFRGEESDWQVTDYPEVTNAAFLSADNGQESVADIELPFTDNSIEARRIARIALERNRQQLTVSASFGLRAFQAQVGDVINLTVSRFGWSSKPFEVVSWTFGLADTSDLQVQMTLREISESVFDEVDDGIAYERDNTTLLSPFDVPNLGISASARLQILNEKLTNIVTVEVTSASSERIDHVEVQFKRSSEAVWRSAGSGEIGRFEVVDLEDNLYDFRARAINAFGVKGEWEVLVNVAATGLAQPPSNVQGLTSEVNGAVINFEWDAVPELDLSYYRIRYTPNTINPSWANSVNYSDKIPRPATSVTVPARSGTFLIKAVDKSGIESTQPASLFVRPEDLEQFATTLTQTEDPTFSGVKTDCIVDGGQLRIGELELFDSLVGNLDSLSGLWDSFGASVTGTAATYDFSGVIDIGSVERARVRVDAITLRQTFGSGSFDDLAGTIDLLPTLWDDLTGANVNFADTNVKAFVSTTDDDPAGTPTWTGYTPLRVSDISARAFRFRVALAADTSGITPAVDELSAVVQYN